MSEKLVERVQAEQQAERLRALNAVSRLVSSSLRVEKVLHAVARAARQLLQVDQVRLWILDPDRRELELVTWDGLGSPDQGYRPRLPLNDSVIGQILERREVYQTAEILDNPRWRSPDFVKAADLHAYLGLPLVAQGAQLGVLSILSRERRLFPDDDVELMQAFAAQAATAIANAQLYAQAERRARRLAAWTEASRLVTSSLELQEVLTAVVRSAKEVLDVDRARLWTLEDDGELVLTAASDPDGVGPGWITRMGADSLLGSVLHSGEVYQTTDVVAHPLVRNRRYMEAEGLRGCIAVPIQVKERPFGVLALLTRQRRTFDADEVNVLRALGHQAAAAIENARLYQVQAKQAARLLALHGVAVSIMSSIRQADLLHTIVEHATRLVGADQGVVFLWDAGAAMLRPAQVVNIDPTRGSPRTRRRDEGITGLAFTERRVHLINDYPSHSAATPHGLRSGLNAIIAAPMLASGEPLGVITVTSHAQSRRFDQEDALVLELLAAQAAVALENARLFEEVGQVEGLRELDRLKTEFLSTVSHELRTPLSYIHGYTELLMVREFPPGEVKEMVREIHRGSSSMVRLVDDLLDISRIESGQLSLRLAPTNLEALLRSAANVFDSQAPDHTVVADLPERPLPPAMVDPERIRQVITNLLSNAVRYSPGGGEVVVRARARGGMFRVEIEDHGVGIPPEEQARVFERFYRGTEAVASGRHGSGLGLAIVKYLIEAHGGQVGVESAIGHGSTFWFMLPARLGSDEPEPSRLIQATT